MVVVQDIVGWNTMISNTLVATDHPDDYIWHTVLRLQNNQEKLALVKSAAVASAIQQQYHSTI